MDIILIAAELSFLMDIASLKHIHFVGIKGVGMTSLALCAQDLGIKVTGSDVGEIFVTDEILKDRKIKWSEGFSEMNLKDKPDLVVTTGAHGGLKNPEVVAAKKLKIPVLTQARALAFFSKGKDLIAVCGVGGKTTTSAIIAHILARCGLHPSYAIGVGKIYPLGYSGKYDKKGKIFICEADEFVNSPGVDNTPRFLFLDPKVVVVTNLEHDHPDVYPTLADTKKAYLAFFQKIPGDGLLVANADDKNIQDLIYNLHTPIVKYTTPANVKTHLPGKYNLRNIAASLAVAEYLGIPKQKAIEAVKSFKGTQRRFEKIGETKDGTIVYDDYAHHPSEIKAVLKAAKELYPQRRIVAVFQPHTYTRTKVLFNDFAKSFINSDIACLMDIYASAREKPDKSVSSKLLAEEVKRFNKNSHYTGNHKNTIEWLKKNLKAKDVVITIGAGDVFYIHKDLLN